MGKKRGFIIAGSILVIFFTMACNLISGRTPSTLASTAVSAASTVVASASTPTAASGAAATVVPTSPPSAAPLISAASGSCANAYYPVPSGATWSYSSTGSSSVGDYTYTRVVSANTATGFSTTDQFSTGVNAIINWRCEDGNLAALDAGSSSFTMSTSKVKMTSDSITADGYNIPASFAAGKTWAEKVTVDGTVVQNGTSKTVKSQIASTLNCSAAGADTVTVPAGKFDTVKADCVKTVVVSALAGGKTTQLASNTQNITYWYAKGVGYVKSVATGGTDNETIVLTAYKIK